ncbi:MAG: hypothetical protein HY459_01540 [Parcubacteria group bacterium]|nr:hypothetical protein [Parcubacteria group bacterium]
MLKFLKEHLWEPPFVFVLYGLGIGLMVAAAVIELVFGNDGYQFLGPLGFTIFMLGLVQIGITPSSDEQEGKSYRRRP